MSNGYEIIDFTSQKGSIASITDMPPTAQQPQRPWYKKKRYLIPLGFVGLVTAAMSSESIQTVQPVVVPATPQIETIKTIQDTQIKKVVPVPVPTPTRECNENYSGCLNPNASDYDCSGGSGNGPYYTGTVRVLGYDEYDLDRDGNGWGCE